MNQNIDSVELWYNSILVGRVVHVVAEDGVCSGVMQLAITNVDDPSRHALLRYIEFCVDWNERTRSQRNPPSPSEFDAFAAIAKSDKWFTKSGGTREAVEDAPVFFKGSEVSWRTKSSDE
jgi:hypothetical protein